MFLNLIFTQKHEFITKNRFSFCYFITNHPKTTHFFVKKIKINIIRKKMAKAL
jgi:hypothetical protein